MMTDAKFLYRHFKIHYMELKQKAMVQLEESGPALGIENAHTGGHVEIGVGQGKETTEIEVGKEKGTGKERGIVTKKGTMLTTMGGRDLAVGIEKGIENIENEVVKTDIMMIGIEKGSENETETEKGNEKGKQPEENLNEKGNEIVNEKESVKELNLPIEVPGIRRLIFK